MNIIEHVACFKDSFVNKMNTDLDENNFILTDYIDVMHQWLHEIDMINSNDEAAQQFYTTIICDAIQVLQKFSHQVVCDLKQDIAHLGTYFTAASLCAVIMATILERILDDQPIVMCKNLLGVVLACCVATELGESSELDRGTELGERFLSSIAHLVNTCFDREEFRDVLCASAGIVAHVLGLSTSREPHVKKAKLLCRLLFESNNRLLLW
jgi:hypothetical protein